MERSLLEVRTGMFPLVDKTALNIYKYLDSQFGAEPRRQLTVIVSNLRQVKHALLSDGNLGGILVAKDPIDIDCNFVISLLKQFQLDHKLDPNDLVLELLEDFKFINPDCKIVNIDKLTKVDGISIDEIRVNRGIFRQHVVSFIDLLVEELEPETHLNLAQIEKVNAIATTFLSKIDSGSKEEGLLKRRSRLSEALLKCASMFRPNDQGSGGVIERTIDKEFQHYVGTEPVFEIKRLAFPQTDAYSEVKGDLIVARDIKKEIKIGEILVIFDDEARKVLGYEVTAVDDNKIKANQITIESKKREPQSYFSSNIPEYVVNRTDSNGRNIEVEIKRNIVGKSFDNIDKLLNFLFEIDQRRYGVYTYMCRYFVSSLRNRIRRGI